MGTKTLPFHTSHYCNQCSGGHPYRNFYAKHFAGNRLGIINGSSNKLNALLRVVDDQYVDSVNMTDLVEKAMPQILAELDPHSTYIPAQKLEAVNSELEGSFSGIGIQFTIQEDTIHVNSVYRRPSEKWDSWRATALSWLTTACSLAKGWPMKNHAQSERT